jgi:hypothetical protein
VTTGSGGPGSESEPARAWQAALPGPRAGGPWGRRRPGRRPPPVPAWVTVARPPAARLAAADRHSETPWAAWPLEAGRPLPVRLRPRTPLWPHDHPGMTARQNARIKSSVKLEKLLSVLRIQVGRALGSAGRFSLGERRESSGIVDRLPDSD